MFSNHGPAIIANVNRIGFIVIFLFVVNLKFDPGFHNVHKKILQSRPFITCGYSMIYPQILTTDNCFLASPFFIDHFYLFTKMKQTYGLSRSLKYNWLTKSAVYHHILINPISYQAY